MDSKSHTFRDQLLKADRTAPELDEKYRKELTAMLEKELSLARKLVFTVVAVAALVSGCVCAFLAATEPELPLAARAALAVGSVFAVAWLFTMIAVLRRGKLQLKTDSRRIAVMVWTFSVLTMVLWLYLGMSSTDPLRGIQIILYGLTFLIGAAVYWLSHMVERNELSTREKLLELELRLAELAEKQQ